MLSVARLSVQDWESLYSSNPRRRAHACAGTKRELSSNLTGVRLNSYLTFTVTKSRRRCIWHGVRPRTFNLNVARTVLFKRNQKINAVRERSLFGMNFDTSNTTLRTHFPIYRCARRVDDTTKRRGVKSLAQIAPLRHLLSEIRISYSYTRYSNALIVTKTNCGPNY